MKTLKEYILEKSEDNKKSTERGNIKFTIWEEPDKKVKWINDNEKYQKIEYKHEDKDKNIFIDFLLGFKDNSWRLWIGKIGATQYDDDPYCDLETTKLVVEELNNLTNGEAEVVINSVDMQTLSE